MGLLIDSTVCIAADRDGLGVAELLRRLLERFGDEETALSVMSAAELLHGCWRARTVRQRAQREEFVETLLSVVPVVAITLPVARVFGRLDASLAARGRRVPTSDLWIASTALVRGDVLVSGDQRHFKGIPGLRFRLAETMER